MIECLNYLNVKFGVFGNHEFVYGSKKAPLNVPTFVASVASSNENFFLAFENPALFLHRLQQVEELSQLRVAQGR